MYTDLSAQLLVFFGALRLGVILGGVFELIRVWRAFLKNGFGIFCLDFLTVVGFVWSTYLYFLHSTSGQIRWYDLLAVTSAFWLFHTVLGRWIYRLLHPAFKAFFSLVRQGFRIIFFPVVFAGRFFRKIIQKIWNIGQIFLKKLFIFLKRYIIIFLYRKHSTVKSTERTQPDENFQSTQQTDITQFFH